MFNKINVLIILLFLIFSSCGYILRVRRVITHNGKKVKLVKKVYANEPLYLRNYIYFHDSIIQNKRQIVNLSTLQQDSLLNIIKNNLLKTKINIKIDDTLINVVDKTISDLPRPLRPRRIKDELVLKHVQDSNTYIIPFIHTDFERGYSITGGYTFSYVNHWGSEQNMLIIYIIQNKEIIYKRTVRLYAGHKENEFISNIYERTMKVEYWDLLIKKAMEDYIKRIKK